MAKKKRRRKLNIARLALLIFALLVVATGGAAFALIYASVADMPTFNPDAINFAAATEIYDENDNLVTRIGAENRIPVDISEVPEMVQNAFIAIEDIRFRDHIGVDPYRILGAAWSDIKTGSLDQGASTITQQLVNQSLDLKKEKSFKRKIREAIYAIQMERHFTKDEILEGYLNVIYLGQGAHGIQAASHAYFNKDVSELTVDEAALIAGLPQAPSAYDPFVNPEAAKERRNIVLDQMAKYGYIAESEASQYKAKEIELNAGEISTAKYPYPYFMDYVISELTDENGDYKLSEADVFRGGMKIYTTLNPAMQQAAETAMANDNNFPPAYNAGGEVIEPNGATVILDPKNGHVKALVGGREHVSQRGWNRATKEKRRPGSTIKPIIAYGPAIEYLGKGPATVIDDIPFKQGSYQPKNDSGSFRGLVTMRQGLTSSINIVAVKLLEDVGLNNSFAFAKKLGIEGLNPKNEGLSAALGGLSTGVTPLQMAAAYGAFANNGVYSEPMVIRKVERLDGTIVAETSPKQQRAMKETTAFLINDMLKDAVTKGTGTRALINRPMAGKTGTTDNSNGATSDIWFAGYTPDLVAVAWIGNTNQNYGLASGSLGAYGGTYTALIWKETMQAATAGLPKNDFVKPSGLVRATVDSKSGLLPGPHTPEDHMVNDYFVQGTVPTGTDNTHVLMEVCATTGQLPSDYCPDRIMKTVVKLPYDVPEHVADYGLRAPTKICDVHTEENGGSWLPDILDSWDQQRDDHEDDNDDHEGKKKEKDSQKQPWLRTDEN
ncbi:PBP1A family penicillin-binding protein [Peptococcaceae bacterium 1198_IL3148]